MAIAYSGRFRRRDLWAIERVASRVLGRGGVLRTTAGFLFATVILVLLAVYAASGGFWNAAIQWLVVALIPGALFAYNAITTYRAYSHDPLVGVPIRGVLSESGFDQSIHDADHHIAWVEIERTGASADYLLLESKARYLYALPRAFFATAEEFASACALAQQCVSPPPVRMTTVRPERTEDASRVRHINQLAFGQPAEADLVDRLRAACAESLSFVAEDETVVGHILFTPVVVEGVGRRVVGMGLAPMAVLPDRQRQGIGSQLVTRGLDVLRERRCPFVVVVGHPEYYPRFGFEPASKHGLASQWDGIPDAAFMVLLLDGPAMAAVSGVARYRDEFNEVA